MKWIKKKVGDLCVVGRGSSPRPINNPAYFEGGKIPWIKIADATASGKFIYKTKEVVTELGASFSRRLQPGALIIATSGVSLGQIKLLGVEGCIHDGWLYVNNFNGIDKEFLYYRLLIMQDEFLGRAYGAAIQNINTEILRESEIYLPPISIQLKIASILSAYDDLIENNLKRIRLLEEAVRILYKNEFGNFQVSNKEFDTLPKGWVVKSIGDIYSKLESGSRPKGGIDKELNVGIASVGAENVIGLGKYNYQNEKLITEAFFEKMNRGIIEDRDILIYKDGAYIGKTTLFQGGFPHEKCCVNEHVFLLRTKDINYQYFLFFTLNQNLYFEKMQQLNANAAQPGINQESLKSLKIIWPSLNAVKEFNKEIELVIKLIFNLAKQNTKLREARDILLPRLMSEEIEV
jgi:type I restriction enzyme S subunit